MDEKAMHGLGGYLASVRDIVNDIREKELLEVIDFSMTTWLALGACLQLFSQWCLPPNLSYWLPLILLTARFGTSLFNCTRIFTGTFTGIKFGRHSTVLPEPEESALTETNSGVVMFLLLARINHPLGKLAPGGEEIDTMFRNMWKEAEKNREKWSYLGRSGTLFDTTDGEGTTVYWLSYWKDLKGLQEFSNCAAHRIGQMAYLKGKFPYTGIAHETYHAPKGHWECIYDNMPPVGMGKTQPVLSRDADGFKFAEALVKDKPVSTMFSRMGRGLPRKKPLVEEQK